MDDECKQIAGRVVCQVDILDDDQYGSPISKLMEQAQERIEQPRARAVGHFVQTRRFLDRVEFGQERSQFMAPVADQRIPLLRIDLVQESPQSLYHRSEGEPAPGEFDTASNEDGGTCFDGMHGELRNQAALPYAGLTADQDGGGLTVPYPPESIGEGFHLAEPPDEPWTRNPGSHLLIVTQRTQSPARWVVIASDETRKGRSGDQPQHLGLVRRSGFFGVGGPSRTFSTRG